MRAVVRRLATAALAVGLLAACHQNADAGASAGADANGPAKGKFTAPEYAMGKPTAKVTVVEYLSDTCSHCAAYDAEVFPGIKKDYIDTGKVKYVIREMLTPPQEVSAAGFLLARCAGRDKYFPVIEAIFHSQPEMFKTGDVKGIFTRIAQSMGMTQDQMTACVSNDDDLKALNGRIQKAIDAGVDGTPTFVFNGKMLKQGVKLAGQDYLGGPLTRAQFDAAYAQAAGGK